MDARNPKNDSKTPAQPLTLWQKAAYVVVAVSYTDIAKQALLIAGGSAIFNYGFDKVNFERQTQKCTPLEAVKNAWARKEAGFGYTILNGVSKTGAVLLTRQYAKNTLDFAYPDNGSQNQKIANFFGGFLGGALTYPIAVKKSRAMNRDKSKLSMRKMYAGFPMLCLRESMHYGVMFGTQDIMKKHSANKKQQAQDAATHSDILDNSVARGAVSGSASAIATNPVANILANQKTFGGNVPNTVFDMHKKYGVKGILCRGMVISHGRLIVQATIVDAVLHLFDHAHDQKDAPKPKRY